jgi:hypothetical protein
MALPGDLNSLNNPFAFYTPLISIVFKRIGHDIMPPQFVLVGYTVGSPIELYLLGSFVLAVLINIPIIKDHRGTRYTGNLKNMMGAASSPTCRRCHYGDYAIVNQIFQGAYDKMELLSQSIADLQKIDLDHRSKLMNFLIKNLLSKVNHQNSSNTPSELSTPQKR